MTYYFKDQNHQRLNDTLNGYQSTYFRYLAMGLVLTPILGVIIAAILIYFIV
jgi:hypothetical protein